MFVKPPHLKDHTFEIHVAGEPVVHDMDDHPEWRYQFCARCGGCLNIVKPDEKPIPTGEMYPYMFRPDRKGPWGAVQMSPELLVWGDLCKRKDHEEDEMSEESCPGTCIQWIERIPIRKSGSCGKPCAGSPGHPHGDACLCEEHR